MRLKVIPEVVTIVTSPLMTSLLLLVTVRFINKLNTSIVFISSFFWLNKAFYSSFKTVFSSFRDWKTIIIIIGFKSVVWFWWKWTEYTNKKNFMVKRGKARARHQFLDKRENLDHLFFWYVFIIQSYISVITKCSFGLRLIGYNILRARIICPLKGSV